MGLKIVSGYLGIRNYINEVKATENADLQQAWTKNVVDPYFNEWAAGQFNEDRVRCEISGPERDIKKVEVALDKLMKANVEELVRTSYEKVISYLPPMEPETAICIYINTELGDDVHGAVGSCVGDNMLLQINPEIDEWKKYISWVIAHEHNHSVWGYNYYFTKGNRDKDLLTTIICEGQADAFASMISGELSPFWTRALAVDEEVRQWEVLKDYLDQSVSMELHKRFFFGDKVLKTPPFVGYTIGFNIVKAFIAKNPNITFVQIADMDAKVILEESGYTTSK